MKYHQMIKKMVEERSNKYDYTWNGLLDNCIKLYKWNWWIRGGYTYMYIVYNIMQYHA